MSEQAKPQYTLEQLGAWGRVAWRNMIRAEKNTSITPAQPHLALYFWNHEWNKINDMIRNKQYLPINEPKRDMQIYGDLDKVITL